MLIARAATDLWDAVRAGQRTFRDVTYTDRLPDGVVIDSCSFQATRFKDARLTGTFRDCTFDGVTFENAGLTSHLVFANCRFIKTVFARESLNAVQFRQCIFRHCQLVEAILVGVVFVGCEFLGSARYEGDPTGRWQWWQRRRRTLRKRNEQTGFDSAQIDRTRFAACQFKGMSFHDAQIDATEFRDCTYVHVDFYGASIIRTEFTSSDFLAVELADTSLDSAMFRESQLDYVSFVNATLERTDFVGCFAKNTDISRARFLAVDLKLFCDSCNTVYVGDVPVIDWRSVCRTIHSSSLSLLLLRCGMPDIVVHYLIDSARAIDPEFVFRMMRSTFISYGAPDRQFARDLHEQLERNGVRTFFFEKDAIPGERLHRVMYDQVNKFDRVILICTESSLARAGVRNEIEETFARESRDGGASYLVPIACDSFVFVSDDPLSRRIRERVVADFRNVTTGSDKFKAAFQQLLAALRNDPSMPSSGGA